MYIWVEYGLSSYLNLAQQPYPELTKVVRLCAYSVAQSLALSSTNQLLLAYLRISANSCLLSAMVSFFIPHSSVILHEHQNHTNKFTCIL